MKDPESHVLAEYNMLIKKKIMCIINNAFLLAILLTETFRTKKTNNIIFKKSHPQLKDSNPCLQVPYRLQPSAFATVLLSIL